jgi:protein O-mannosyl-transferase
MSANRGYAWLWLALLAVLPYVTGLDHAFVYDDHGVLVENAFLEKPSNILRVLSLQTMRDPAVIDGQRPVVVASYFIDRHVWALHPAGCRVTNLLLHGAVTALIFILFRTVTRQAWLSAAAALLFAWHPLAVEAVQSPAFREDLLYMAGGLVYLIAGAYPLRSLKRGAAGLFFLALALLSKEAAVIFPVLLAAIWWLFPESRPGRKVMAMWIVSSITLVALYVVVMASGRPVQAMGGVWNGISLRGSECLWTAPWLAGWLTGKMVVPYPLSIDYVITPVTGLVDIRFLAGMLLVVAGIVTAWRGRYFQPTVSFAVIWMLALFLPVSNLVALINPAADRYAYGVLPGFTLLVVVGLNKLPRFGAPIFLIILFSGLAVTVMRIGEWRDDRTLWTSAFQVEPASSRAYTWMGLLEKRDGRMDAALEMFVAAEKLNPHNVSPTINRAIMLGERGELDEAEHLLRDVLARRPDHEQARQNLETCLRLKEASQPRHRAVP